MKSTNELLQYQFKNIFSWWQLLLLLARSYCLNSLLHHLHLILPLPAALLSARCAKLIPRLPIFFFNLFFLCYLLHTMLQLSAKAAKSGRASCCVNTHRHGQQPKAP